MPERVNLVVSNAIEILLAIKLRQIKSQREVADQTLWQPVGTGRAIDTASAFSSRRLPAVASGSCTSLLRSTRRSTSSASVWASFQA